MSLIPIVGREEELQRIDEIINSNSLCDLICIVGPGGIGKTRLLLEVRERYKKNQVIHKNIQVSEIVSFDDPSLHIADNVRKFIVNSLGEQCFLKYSLALSDWIKMKDAGISIERLINEETLVDEAFINDFNNIATRQKVLLFFDTIDEELGYSDSWNYLIKLIPRLKNVVIIAGGRIVDRLYRELQAINGGRKLIILNPLKEIASEEYLLRKQRQLHISIDHNISSKIIRLAKGRPILIDLAVEWMSREAALPWLLQDIQEFDNFEAEFEKQLIRPIAELRSHLDRLILVTSYIYPVSEKFISTLFQIGPDETHKLFQQSLSKFVYFKPVVHDQLILHDEIRRMVNKWIWPEIDPLYERRVDYSSRFIKFAENEVTNIRRYIENQQNPQKLGRGAPFEFSTSDPIKDFDKEDLWALENLRLMHTLKVDPHNGFILFENLYQKSTGEYEFSNRQAILHVMGKNVELLSEKEKLKFDIYKAHSYSETGKPQNAYDLLSKYKSPDNVDLAIKVQLLIILGNCATRLGRIDEAERFLSESLDLSISSNDAALRGKSELALGSLRQLQGRWNQANKLYLSALKYCFQVEDLVNAGILLNSIGYIHCLKGDYISGRNSCSQALDIFEKISRLREKAMVFSTLGEIYTASEQFEEAMRNYSQAMEAVEVRKDWEWICILKYQVAHSLWVQNKYEEALKYIRESLNIAETHNLWKEFPNIYYHLGWIAWDHSKFVSLGDQEYELSVSNFKKSYDESIKYQDKFLQLSNLVALAEIAAIFGKNDLIPLYAKELKEEIKAGNLEYPLLQGQMERIQGNIDYDLAQTQNDLALYTKSLRHYIISIPLISKHGGTGRYSLVNELLFLGDRIDDLDAQIAIVWCVEMRTQWGKKHEVISKHPELLNFCNVHLALAKSRLKE